MESGAGGESAPRGLAGGAAGGRCGAMSRPAIAALAGIAGFILYVLAVLQVADLLRGAHWAVELVFFAVAGVAWVWPAKRLMVWGAR